MSHGVLAWWHTDWTESLIRALFSVTPSSARVRGLKGSLYPVTGTALQEKVETFQSK